MTANDYPSSPNDPGLGFIHRFLPAETGVVMAAPTLLLLHGTGGNENQMLPFGRQAAGPGWNLLSPRGNVLEWGDSPRFFRRLAEGVFDEADVIRRAHELADFVEAAATRYHFDPRRVFALGYSNGANIAGAVLLLRPSILAGAGLLRPMVPLIPSVLPVLRQPSILVSAGRRDPIATEDNVTGLVELLQRCGARVQLSWYAVGHELAGVDAQAATTWLQEMKDGAASALAESLG